MKKRTGYLAVAHVSEAIFDMLSEDERNGQRAGYLAVASSEEVRKNDCLLMQQST